MNNQCKTTIKTLLIMAFSLSFSMADEHSAESPAGKRNDLKEFFHLSDNIESITSQTCYIKDKFEKSQNKNCMPKVVLFFDENGNQTGMQRFSHDDKLLENMLIDDQGEHRSVHRILDAEGHLLRKKVIVRSATHGKVIELHTFSKDNQLENTSKMTYNPDGTLEAETVLDRDGNQMSKTVFEYNDKQQMAKQTSYGISGKFTQSYFYDEYGNVSGTDIAPHQLTLDEKNNWIQRKAYAAHYRQNKKTLQLSRIDYRTIIYRD